jgi:membrane protease YdiL (CAAX protease family)
MIYGVQILLASMGVGGVLPSAVSDVACIVCFWVYARKRRIGARGLGFVHVGGLWYVAAVLVGASAWYVNLTIVTLLHVPQGPTEVLEGLVEKTPLVSTLAALAVLPPFAEEIVFRGVLARGLATARPPWQAILISSAVFGAYHILPAQAAATFLLGCLLAFLTLRSGSIVPAIIVHFLNNVIAIVVTRETVPGFGTWMMNHPAVMLSSAVTLLLGGIAVAMAAPRQEAAA